MQHRTSVSQSGDSNGPQPYADCGPSRRLRNMGRRARSVMHGLRPPCPGPDDATASDHPALFPGSSAQPSGFSPIGGFVRSDDAMPGSPPCRGGQLLDPPPTCSRSALQCANPPGCKARLNPPGCTAFPVCEISPDSVACHGAGTRTIQWRCCRFQDSASWRGFASLLAGTANRNGFRRVR